MRRTAAALAIAAFALTGCVRVTAATTFSDEDTLSQHTVIAMTSQARTAFGQQLDQLGDLDLPEGTELPEGADADVLDGLDALLDPETMREGLAPLEEAHPGSVSVEPYEDEDGLEGVEIELTGIPIDELADAGGAAPVGGASSVTREGDSYVVQIESGAASGLAAAGAGADDLTLLGAAVDIEASFTFPGLVTEATAGEIVGNTVTLGLSDLLAADTIRIVGGATTEHDWGPLLKWLAVIAGALVIIGGATALVLQDRRRRHESHLPPPRGSEGGPGTLDDRTG
ncbi:LppM family (lipo)protein [Demequina mangrovi]|uniref:LppM domain-containing protein n=1 Tax=Demequina mangrovi TaxID=1043493 RepID=A0A1H7AQ64_9MICO|nr:hypothetical protein [Demequina mangrovi]SEJ66764.1 hypothetical protein SAMN05421637_2616 [Demequina mangrovi]